MPALFPPQDEKTTLSLKVLFRTSAEDEALAHIASSTVMTKQKETDASRTLTWVAHHPPAYYDGHHLRKS
jgi:hypothetical protein